MKKVLVIAGPTASGKTSFSIQMAEKYNLEIISGDSIQVYKGLDIGSGKVTEKEKHGIKHYLIDILSPKDSYSVSDFQKMARDLIDHSEKPMIIAGGTGLYLKACLYDYTFDEESEDLPSVDPSFEKMDEESLYQLLVKVDPKQAEKIHPNNRRRILRSLTIWKRTGKPQSEIVGEQSHKPVYDAFIAGCTMEREKLYQRINNRVEQMFQDGLEEEVRHLLEQGVSFSDTCMQGIGYKEWKPYFEGNSTVEEVKQEIQKHSRQFAKRQYTWLNHQMDVHWFDSTDEKDILRIESEIDTWIER